MGSSPSAPSNPFAGAPQALWLSITQSIIAQHPLSTAELIDVTLQAWQSIFSSSLGGYHIGSNIQPEPQIMSFFLHQLVSLEIGNRYPGVWRPNQSKSDKDIVYIPDIGYSIEIKASSDPNNVYGNRSYAQPGVVGTKGKSGYYLTVNFDKFQSNLTTPQIRRIKFGWLDHTDWRPQRASSGQQASIIPAAKHNKLIQLYP